MADEVFERRIIEVEALTDEAAAKLRAFTQDIAAMDETLAQFQRNPWWSEGFFGDRFTRAMTEQTREFQNLLRGADEYERRMETVFLLGTHIGNNVYPAIPTQVNTVPPGSVQRKQLQGSAEYEQRSAEFQSLNSQRLPAPAELALTAAQVEYLTKGIRDLNAEAEKFGSGTWAGGTSRLIDTIVPLQQALRQLGAGGGEIKQASQDVERLALAWNLIQSGSNARARGTAEETAAYVALGNALTNFVQIAQQATGVQVTLAAAGTAATSAAVLSRGSLLGLPGAAPANFIPAPSLSLGGGFPQLGPGGGGQGIWNGGFPPWQGPVTGGSGGGAPPWSPYWQYAGPGPGGPPALGGGAPPPPVWTTLATGGGGGGAPPPPPPPPGGGNPFAASIANQFLRSLIVYGLLWEAVRRISEATATWAQNNLQAEQSLRLVEFVAQGTGTTLQALAGQQRAMLQISAQYGIAPQQALPASVYAARTTPDLSQQQDLQRRSAQLVQFAPDMTQEQAAERLYQITKSFGGSLNDVGTIADAAALAYEKSNVDLSEYLDTMERVAPIMRDAGLTIEEASGYVAAFSQATGESPSKIETMLEAVAGLRDRSSDLADLSKLNIPTQDADAGGFLPAPQQIQQVANVWGNLTEEQQASAAIALVGRKNYQEMLDLLGNYKMITQYVREFNTEQDTANQLSKTYNETLLGRWNLFTAQLGAMTTDPLLFQQQDRKQGEPYSFYFKRKQEEAEAEAKARAEAQKYAQTLPQPGDAGFIGPVRPIGPSPLDRRGTQVVTAEADSNLGARAPAPSLQYSDQSLTQLRQQIQTGTQVLDQYRQSVVAAGYPTKELDEQWAKVGGAIRDSTGTLTLFTNKELEALRIGGQMQQQLRLPSFQQTDWSPNELNRNVSAGLQIGQQQVDSIRQMNIPVAQQNQMVQQLQAGWAQTTAQIRLANGALVTLTGPAAALVGLGAQATASWQRAMLAMQASAQVSVQTVSGLNATNVAQLQQYLVYYENFLRQMGVMQTAQQYLLFGQNGFAAQFNTSSQAMQLALALLGEQIDLQQAATMDNVNALNDNTSAQKDTLRGSFNVPTEFGYKPPTPWDYYSRGGHEMGPVNYPWLFGDDADGKKHKLTGVERFNLQPHLGEPPTGSAGLFQTTFGAKPPVDPIVQMQIEAMKQSELQGKIEINTAATAANTSGGAGAGGSIGVSGAVGAPSIAGIGLLPAVQNIFDQYHKMFQQLGTSGGAGLPIPPGGVPTSQNDPAAPLKAMADRLSQQNGITDPNILRAIIQAESNWNPNAVGDGGNSIGLLQNNRAGGRGTGYSVEQLKDPSFNLQLGIGEIAQWVQKGIAQGLSGADLAAFAGKGAQRPAAGGEQNYADAYNQILRASGGVGAMQVTLPPELLDPLRGLGKLSQAFGEHPEDYKRFGLPGHEGVDYSAPQGTPVYAAAAGTIETVGNGPTYGNQVLEKLASGAEILYAHLMALPDLKVGDKVTTDTQVGQVGDTGNSTGPHLHLGYKPADPADAPEGYKGWADPSELFKQQMKVEGVPQVQAATQLTATNTSLLATSLPLHFQTFSGQLGAANSLLGQLLVAVNRSNALLARPQDPPTFIVTAGGSVGAPIKVKESSDAFPTSGAVGGQVP